MSARPITALVAPGQDPRALLAAVTAALATRALPRQERRRVYLETFDGRLHRAGVTLFAARHGGRVELGWDELAAGRSERLPLRRVPHFTRELPAGELRQRLAALADPRRLFPLVEVEVDEETLEVVDGADKIVARLVLSEGRARATGSRAWAGLAAAITLQPVLGYDSVADELGRSLAVRPELWADGRPLVERALLAVGRPLPGDRSRLDVALVPGLRADVGLRRVFRALLDTIELNAPHVCADEDPEFLHDLRVAVRRTRVLLGQLQHVLSEPESTFGQDELRWLWDLTGPVRDTDVLLLRFEVECQELSALALGPVRVLLLQQRTKEFARLQEGLRSARYRRLVETWRRIVDEQPGDDGTVPAHAAEPLETLVARAAQRRFRRLVEAPDQGEPSWHRLRLDGKKLRYLLECCRRLFDDEQVDAFLGHLRRLQDALGDVQDARVQGNRVVELARAVRPVAPATLLEAGRLIERLSQQSARGRSRSGRHLRRLVRTDGRRRLHALLASRPGRGRQ